MTKKETRAGDMSKLMGYEAVEVIVKDRAEPLRRGSSIITFEGFVFKGGEDPRLQGVGGGRISDLDLDRYQSIPTFQPMLTETEITAGIATMKRARERTRVVVAVETSMTTVRMTEETATGKGVKGYKY